MCTVAFVPRGSGYLLGHNRDELRSRAVAQAPRNHQINGIAVLAPRDPDGGGSWIGVNQAGTTYCVLNGRETDPDRNLGDPLSRGRVLWEALGLDDPGRGAETVARHALENVRAFQLLAVGRSSGSAPRVLSVKWDGREVTRGEHSVASLFVSSSYAGAGARVGAARTAQWRELLAVRPVPDRAAVREWLAGHRPERGPLSVCMHRPEARTVSRTMVQVNWSSEEDRPRVTMDYTEGPPCAPRLEERRSTLHSP